MDTKPSVALEVVSDLPLAVREVAGVMQRSCGGVFRLPAHLTRAHVTTAAQGLPAMIRHGLHTEKLYALATPFDRGEDPPPVIPAKVTALGPDLAELIVGTDPGDRQRPIWRVVILGLP